MERFTDITKLKAAIDKSKGSLLVKFTASWCPPCKVFGPMVKKVATSYPDVKIVEFDVGEGVTTECRKAPWKVRGVPLLIAYEDGVEADRVLGAIGQNELKNWMEAAFE